MKFEWKYHNIHLMLNLLSLFHHSADFIQGKLDLYCALEYTTSPQSHAYIQLLKPFYLFLNFNTKLAPFSFSILQILKSCLRQCFFFDEITLLFKI